NTHTLYLFCTTWSKAQSHCRSDFTDLATIDGPDTMQRLTDITAASGKGRSIWIGLNKAGESVWMWSSGEILGEFSNWIRPLTALTANHRCMAVMKIKHTKQIYRGHWHKFITVQLCLKFILSTERKTQFKYEVLKITPVESQTK
uniref:C-type lectin domain-containing protein n=1 Tax=Mola mola TaxID=94237 RepID=A0A3Q4ADP1_MOLML